MPLPIPNEMYDELMRYARVGVDDRQRDWTAYEVLVMAIKTLDYGLRHASARTISDGIAALEDLRDNYGPLPLLETKRRQQ